MTDWIEWSGGDCPVPPDTVVQAKFVSDYWGTTGAEGAARRFSWARPSLYRYGDIVAYRVVPQNPVPDLVNNPPHYTDGGIEAIDYIEAKLGPDGFRSYCVGNALKYISRAGKKGPAKEDLSKAIWYLRRAGGE